MSDVGKFSHIFLLSNLTDDWISYIGCKMKNTFIPTLYYKDIPAENDTMEHLSYSLYKP
jgi:hypothetical protein